MTEPATDPRKEVLPTVALVLSCLGFILGPLASIPGIICGHIALKRQTEVVGFGKGLAIASICVGYAFLALWSLILAPFLFTMGASVGLQK